MNILVTGGTRGLGLAIVRQQIAAGHQVWALGRNCSQPLQELMQQNEGRCHFLPCDLGQELPEISESLKQHIGQTAIDGLVCNAAIAYQSLVTHADPSQIQRLFQVNVLAAMEVSRFVVRSLLFHQRPGSLVFLSSVTTAVGSKGLSYYAATKGALQAYSKNVAQEWGSRGIRSNCVVPGFMETDMSAGLTESQTQAIARRSALKRLVDVDSVAGLVGYLLSDAAVCVTGQDWCIDAGAR